MQRPPPGVKLVIEAVCIMKGIKPKKVPGEKPGSKVDDYWEPGKGLLQDPGRFLESLFKFDKVTMLSIGGSPWVGCSRMEKCLPHQYLQVLWSCSSSICPATSCSTRTPGGHRGVWDRENRAVSPLPQVAVRGGDSLSLPNRCLRKLGSGQEDVAHSHSKASQPGDPHPHWP